MKFLKFFLICFQKIGVFIGDVISTIFLVIFYYSVFLLFALPARIFTDYLKSRTKVSTWNSNLSTISQLEDFKNE